jgi:hypothetical protein
MWMALPRHGCRSQQPTTDNAPRTVEPQVRHEERVANRAHTAERSLRRRSEVCRCIRLIVAGLRQVHWWYSESTKDSGHEEQNQNPTVSLHDQPPQAQHRLLPQTSDVKRRVLILSRLIRWDEKVDPRSRMALSYRNQRTLGAITADKEIDLEQG